MVVYGNKGEPASDGPGLQNRRFLNEGLITDDHYGALPASGVKRSPKASERPGRPNRGFLNKS